MKRILFIGLIGMLFLFGCSQINQSIISLTVMGMEFKENGKVVVVQESINKHCRGLIYDPTEYIVNPVKAKYAYQDCMAAYGFICVDYCAY
jgi:hypothetical protein